MLISDVSDPCGTTSSSTLQLFDNLYIERGTGDKWLTDWKRNKASSLHTYYVHIIHSPTGDLGEIAGVNGCQGGKPGTGKLYTDVCLCCSAHTSGCMVDGLGATAAF